MPKLSHARVLALLLLGWGCKDADSPPDDLGRACARLVECAHASRDEQAACEERLSNDYDEAASYGCAGPYSNWVACLASSAYVCPLEADSNSAESDSDSSSELQSCDEQQTALQRCRGEHRRDECVLIGNVGGAGGAAPSGCILSCALFSAQCAPADGAQSCACSTGDKSGARFSVLSCSDGVEQPARDACQ